MNETMNSLSVHLCVCASKVCGNVCGRMTIINIVKKLRLNVTNITSVALRIQQYKQRLCQSSDRRRRRIPLYNEILDVVVS